MNILEKVIYAFNKMSNVKNVGPNGELTYDLVKELEQYNKTLDKLLAKGKEMSESVEKFQRLYFKRYGYILKVNESGPELTYEEKVEIFKEFSDDEKTSRFTGAEYHESAMEKAKQIFNQLPKTSY
jgi:hypothetical protein